MITEVGSKSSPVIPIAQAFPQQQPSAAPAGHKVLIVEDDAALGRFLSRELSLKSFQATVCQDGEEAYKQLQSSSYDLVVMDLNLPKMDGMDLLKHIHASNPHLPVLVLSARNSTEDLVQALERGAQDYLMKPFSLLELLARVRTLLRRTSLPIAATSPKPSTLTINKEERRIMRGQRSIDLTPREFALLEHLVENAGKPVSRMTLMQEVWNVPFDPSTNIVDVYMKYLRDKIDVEGEPKLIRTVRGVGYVLSAE